MAANEEGRLYFGLSLDNSQLQTEARRASNMLKGIGDSAEAEGARIDNAYKRIAGAVGGYFTFEAAKSFITQIVKVRGEIESLSISFETLLGNKQKADALFGQIKEYATKTPLELTPLAKGAQTLLSFNVEAEKVMPILKQIGDVSMGNSDKFNSLTLAFSQMYSTGKLMGQDLLQMINAGFNPLTIIAEKSGKSIAELKDKMSAGAISAEMVADAFKSATDEGGKFHGMLEKQSAGIEGSISNLQGAIDDMFNELGTKGQGVITSTIAGVTSIVEHYEETGRAIAGIVVAYGAYKAALILHATLQKAYNAELMRQAVIEQQRAATLGINMTLQQAQNAVIAAGTVQVRLHTLAQQGLVKALNAVKASLLANPYALAAAAVVALGYGIYKLITYQSDAEKAQKRLNDSISEFNKETAAERAEIDRLFGKLRNTSREAGNYQKIKDEIISKYGSYLKGLGEEIEKLNDVEAAYRAISAAARQSAVDRAVTNAMRKEEDAYAKKKAQLQESMIEEIRKKISDPGAADAFFETINLELEHLGDISEETKNKLKGFDYTIVHQSMGTVSSNGGTYNSLQPYIDALEKNDKLLEDSQDKIRQKFGLSVNEYQSLAQEQVEAYFKSFNEALAKFNETGESQTVNVFGRDVVFGSSEEISLHIAKLKSVRKEMEEGIVPKKKEYVDITKEIENTIKNISDLKQEISDLQSGKTQVEVGISLSDTIENKVKELNDAEKKLAALAGIDKTAAKTQREANKLKTETAERLAAIKEAQEKIKRQELDYELEVQQEIINLMDEGTEKKLMQIDLDFEKRKAEIAGNADELIKQQQNIERDIWEAENPKWKEQGMTFTPKTVSVDLLSDGQKKYLDSQYVLNEEARRKAQRELQTGLIELYQDYAAKRLAIEKRFNDDIAALQSERVKAEAAGNTQAVEQLERAIAQATKDRGKELITFDFDVLQESPEYVRAFEDLKNTSTETLNSLLGQLEQMKGKAAEVLNPADLREYTNTIQDLKNELNIRNPFAALAKAQNELNEANKELVKSTMELNVALMSGDENSIVEAKENHRKALDDVTESNNNLIKAQNEVIDKIGTLNAALRGVGEELGGQAGEIIVMIADIGDFVGKTIKGIEAAATAGSEALAAIEKASVILTIIQAVIRILQVMEEYTVNVHQTYQEVSAWKAAINGVRDAVYEYEQAVLSARQAEEGWFATDRIRGLADAYEYAQGMLERYYSKLNEVQAEYINETGDGFLSNAWNSFKTSVKLPRDFIARNNLWIETRKAKSGFFGIGKKSQQTANLVDWARANGFGELFDEEGLINTAAAEAILKANEEGVIKLVGETEKTLEQLVEFRKQYDEYRAQLQEYVSSLYEPLVDNMVDSLWAWFDEGKDALDSFKEYAGDTFRDIVSDMMKTIIMKNVVGSFSNDIADLYDQYAQGKMSEEDLMSEVARRTGDMIGAYETQLPALRDMMNVLNDSLSGIGIDMKNTSDQAREASAKGLASMSQDSADELNGRFIAMQAHTYYITESMKILVANSNQALRHLAGIESNTESCRRLDGMDADLKAIRYSIDDIALKGVTVR